MVTISCAAFAASGELRISTSIARTRASGSSAASNARSMYVGAIGENASIARAARKCASTCSNRVFGSGAGDGVVGRSAGASASRLPAAAAVTVFSTGSQSRRGLSITARGIDCVTIRSMTAAISRCFGRPSLGA